MDVLLIRTGLCDTGGDPHLGDTGRDHEDPRAGRAVDQTEDASRDGGPYL